MSDLEPPESPPALADIPSPHDVDAPPSTALTRVESLIREHPVASVLTLIGMGCAVGLVLRELLTPPPPPPPKNKALRLLEDIQAKLAHLTEPAYSKASHLAEGGVDAMKRHLHSLGKTKAGSPLKRWF